MASRHRKREGYCVFLLSLICTVMRQSSNSPKAQLDHPRADEQSRIVKEFGILFGESCELDTNQIHKNSQEIKSAYPKTINEPINRRLCKVSHRLECIPVSYNRSNGKFLLELDKEFIFTF